MRWHLQGTTGDLMVPMWTLFECVTAESVKIGNFFFPVCFSVEVILCLFVVPFNVTFSHPIFSNISHHHTLRSGLHIDQIVMGVFSGWLCVIFKSYCCHLFSSLLDLQWILSEDALRLVHVFIPGEIHFSYILRLLLYYWDFSFFYCYFKKKKKPINALGDTIIYLYMCRLKLQTTTGLVNQIVDKIN